MSERVQQQQEVRVAEAAANSGVIPYDKFLNFLNDAGADDEGTLVNVFNRDPVDQPPDPSTVVASVYKPQKYYRKDDDGSVSFYVAWTLFVGFADGTIKCWMKAADVLTGIGYNTNDIQIHLKQYAAHQYIEWKHISAWFYYPHASGGFSRNGGGNPHASRIILGNGGGIKEAHRLRENTIFLTENGVLQLHQLSPKCKAFRNTVANFLLWVRSNFTSKNYALVSKDRLRALEEIEVEHAARQTITGTVQAEKDREIAELRESLSRAQVEYAARTHDMELELDARQMQLDETRGKLEQSETALSNAEARVTSAMEELKQALALRDAAEADRQAAEVDRDQARRESDLAHAEAQRLREDVTTVREELRRLTVLREAVESELLVERDRVNQLRGQVNSLQTELSASTAELDRTRVETTRAKSSLNTVRLEYKSLLTRVERMRLIVQNPVNFYPLSGRLRYGQEDSFCILWIGQLNVSNQYPSQRLPTTEQRRDLYLLLCRQRRSLGEELRAFYGNPLQYGMLTALKASKEVELELALDHLEPYRYENFAQLMYPCRDEEFSEPQHRRFLCATSNSIGFKSALTCSSRLRGGNDGSVNSHAEHHLKTLQRNELRVIAGQRKLRRCARTALFDQLSESERASILALNDVQQQHNQAGRGEDVCRSCGQNNRWAAAEEQNNEEDDEPEDNETSGDSNRRLNEQRLRDRYECRDCRQANASMRESMSILHDRVPLACRTPLRSLFVNGNRSTILAFNCDANMSVEALLNAVRRNHAMYSGMRSE